MPLQSRFPTPYADVNAVINFLHENLQTTLSDEFLGLYLHGSLALGDFDPVSSDIDFLVVTHHVLTDTHFATLDRIHHTIEASGLKWVAKIEGSYFPKSAIHHYDPHHSHHPRYDFDTKMHMCWHGSDQLLQNTVLREQGVIVAGPDPKTFMAPIDGDTLRQASRGILNEWWVPQIEDHTRLVRPGYEVYAILTMCRILYTLQHGTVVSKPVAARWAQETLAPEWHDHIGRALAHRASSTLGTVPKTVDFIRYTKHLAEA